MELNNRPVASYEKLSPHAVTTTERKRSTLVATPKTLLPRWGRRRRQGIKSLYSSLEKLMREKNGEATEPQFQSDINLPVTQKFVNIL
jgi:hypothetical protein